MQSELREAAQATADTHQQLRDLGVVQAPPVSSEKTARRSTAVEKNLKPRPTQLLCAGAEQRDQQPATRARPSAALAKRAQEIVRAYELYFPEGA